MEAAGRVRLRADDARLARKKEQDAAARARYREKGKAQKAQKAQEREAQEAQEVQEAEVREAQETQEAGHYPFVYYWPQEEQEAADLLARARQVAQEVAAERAAVAERLEVGTRTRRHQAWAGLVMNPVPQAAPVAGTSGTTYEGDDQRSVDERQRQRRRDELQQQLQRERGQYDQMQWEDGRGRGGR